jgi:hypothetical protein
VAIRNWSRESGTSLVSIGGAELSGIPRHFLLRYVASLHFRFGNSHITTVLNLRNGTINPTRNHLQFMVAV